MKKFLAILAVIMVAFVVATPAEAAELPPNATGMAEYKGDTYALYKGRCAALHAVKHGKKHLVVPKSIKVKGKRYKVVAIHELGLFERNDVRKVTIKADGLETVEEPALFKDWREGHGKKLKVKVRDAEMRSWLDAEYGWR